jgi:hypothetical protein
VCHGWHRGRRSGHRGLPQQLRGLHPVQTGRRLPFTTTHRRRRRHGRVTGLGIGLTSGFLWDDSGESQQTLPTQVRARPTSCATCHALLTTSFGTTVASICFTCSVVRPGPALVFVFSDLKTA